MQGWPPQPGPQSGYAPYPAGPPWGEYVPGPGGPPPPGGFGPPPPWGYGPAPPGAPNLSLPPQYPPFGPVEPAAPSCPPYSAGAQQHFQHASQQPYAQAPGVPASWQGVPPPTQNAPQPPPAPFQPTGRRKALICACNYRGSHAQLAGCVNDAHCMRYLLRSRFNFDDAEIVMLTDDQGDPSRWPTRANMLYQMQLLTWNCQPGDSLVFHYSGHGSQVPGDGLKDEEYNQTLCPCDFTTAGMIVDDEINRLLVNPLVPGCRLHAVIDACHSGSTMDLEFRCKWKNGTIQWKTQYSQPPLTYKGTRGGEAIQFGASRDKQTAADTAALSGNVSTGAATFAFIQAIERFGTHVTYGDLLTFMTHALQAANPGAGQGLTGLIPAGLGQYGDMLRHAVDGALDLAGMSGQTPVMCCNMPFDLSRPIAL